MSNNPVADLIKRRVFMDDMDCVAVFIGERGGGKSTSAIAWGHKLDKNFCLPIEMLPKGLVLKKGEVMPRVVFRASDFMKLISDYDLPRGSVVCLEEVGLMMDSREALSKTNRMLKKTFESIRSKNLIVFLTVPTLGSFDIGVRRSLTMIFECQGLSKQGKKRYCKNRVLTIQTNAKSGKIYYHSIKWNDPVSVFPKKLTWINVAKPPSNILNPYVRAKEIFQKETYRGFGEEMEAIDSFLGVGKEGSITPISLEDRMNEVMKAPNKYYDFEKKRFNASMFEIGLGVSSYEAIRLKRLLEFQVRNKTITMEE